MTPVRLLISATFFALGIAPAFATSPNAQPQRIRIEYVKPTNPDHQALYEHIKERRVLEKLQVIFGPFKLPMDLKFETVGCDGRSNAWYHRPTITLCYEYLEEIQKNVPKEPTPAGVTASDAMVGQLFYVVAHEFGHAVFDLLQLPSFGHFEDIADQFSTYMMLQFGKEDARRLISGAAYSYKGTLQTPVAFVPLKAFSDVHGLPAQRFFNLLCMAYGADPTNFAEIVEDKYLPKDRAEDCPREYSQVAFAFQELIGPHVDEALAKKVFAREWLPAPSNAAAPARFR